MGMVPYTNESAKFEHLGGTTIPPGDTRMVDETLVPGYEPAGDKPAGAAEGGASDDGKDEQEKLLAAITAMLALNVPDIQAKLPELSDKELDALELAESGSEGKNRTTLLQAIATETLGRVK